jgi:putative transposase
MKTVKQSSRSAVNQCRGAHGELWQPRFFDHALRTVKEYNEKVEYIHLNPVRAGLVRRPEHWRWSSYNEYVGMSAQEQNERCGLIVNRVRMPSDPRARI